MQLSTINELWRKDHPRGEIRWHARAGKAVNGFEVHYGGTGKWYHYRTRTVLGLAERFDLIPSIDVPTLARGVVDALSSGQESVIAVSSLSDTARVYWYERYPDSSMSVDCEPIDECDDYGRNMAKYTLYDRTNDPWSCTV